MLRCALLFLILTAAFAQTGLCQKAHAAPEQSATAGSRPGQVSLRMRHQYRNYEIDLARSLTDRILSVSPAERVNMYSKARAHASGGKRELAVQTVQEIYPASPDSASMLLAALALQAENALPAREGLWYTGEARRLSASSPFSYLAEASLLLSDSLINQARAAAISGARLLRDKDGMPMQAHFAYVLHRSGAKEFSYSLINKLLSAYPDDSLVITHHYLMLMHDQEYPESITELNRLLKRWPDNRDLQLERAFLYHMLGLVSEACADATKLSAGASDYNSLFFMFRCPESFADLRPLPGRAFTYDVADNSRKYELIVRPQLVRIGERISFEWRTNMRNSQGGTVDISREALDTAHGQVKQFPPGRLSLDRQTALWISTDVYRDIKQSGITVIEAPGGSPKVFRRLPESNEVSWTVIDPSGKSKALKTLHMRSDDGTEHLWINDDPSNPMIVRIDRGWSMRLRQIN